MAISPRLVVLSMILGLASVCPQPASSQTAECDTASTRFRQRQWEHAAAVFAEVEKRLPSCEQPMDSSPERSGPLLVPNKYHGSPSLMMDGSWVYSIPPSSLSECAWSSVCAKPGPQAEAITASTRSAQKLFAIYVHHAGTVDECK